MNKIVNKFLLAGDAPKPEMHLRQPVFTYSACLADHLLLQKRKHTQISGKRRFIIYLLKRARQSVLST